MIEIFTDIKKIDINKWSDFVKSHPNGNIFQSPDYYLVPNNKSFFIIAFDNGEVKGVMAGVVQQQINGIAGYFTSRAIIMGGPLIKNNDIFLLKKILFVYKQQFSKKVLFTQFRNIYDMTWAKETFCEIDFKFYEHLDILIPLNVEETALLSSMHKSRKRNFVKSTNKGVKLYEIKGLDDLKEGIDLIKETYSRIKLPYPKEEMFINTYKLLSPKGQIKGFIAKYDNETIGFRLVFLYNNLVYDWFAGSSFEHRNKYPNDFLIYHILLWGNHNGYKIFDFGGAGTPNEKYGVRDHKIKFGGQLVNYGRFQMVHRAIIYYPVMNIFRYWRKFRKKF